MLFFMIQVVSANKDSQQDLLAEYYNGEEIISDTTKAAPEIKVIQITKADSLIDYAKTLLGKGYVYGKVGPDNFDCSGYIFHVFNKFNISLPHSSRAQAKLGDVLPRTDIQKGDLLFFKSPSANNPNIGHVGIAIENNDGKIKFIHSSSNRGVVIDSLESRHYGKRFMEARRIIAD